MIAPPAFAVWYGLGAVGWLLSLWRERGREPPSHVPPEDDAEDRLPLWMCTLGSLALDMLLGPISIALEWSARSDE